MHSSRSHLLSGTSTPRSRLRTPDTTIQPRHVSPPPFWAIIDSPDTSTLPRCYPTGNTLRIHIFTPSFSQDNFATIPTRPSGHPSATRKHPARLRRPARDTSAPSHLKGSLILKPFDNGQTRVRLYRKIAPCRTLVNMSPSSTIPPSPHSTSLIHTIGPYIPLSDSDSSSSSSPTPPPTRGGRFEGFPLLGAHQEGLSSLRSTQQSQSSARTIYNVQGSNKSQFHSRSSSNAPHQHRGPSPDILAVHREKAFKQSPPLASRPLIAESPHFLPFVPSEGSRSLRHIQLAEPIAESDRSLESDGNARKELQQAQIWEGM
ncbi:hypothetical protein SISNIDRAFT_67441 [Sistotremastrum niveocremeum HHB9708]|uniref:Uncharacterized protein n=1 Tax=Sistotremastrum niveocremeum HHB9708 TaxID=1314777 RepID=A0A164V1K7_9AGAM|nr:hypothetical protein SISNIDRAFT_67441 [Sistotremastrum niveocremeum HHB9708]